MADAVGIDSAVEVKEVSEAAAKKGEGGGDADADALLLLMLKCKEMYLIEF